MRERSFSSGSGDSPAESRATGDDGSAAVKDAVEFASAEPVIAAGRTAKASRAAVAVGWVLVALWAGFIFYMSSNTGSGLNDGPGIVSQVYRALHSLQASLLGPDVDVVSSCAHFCEYTVFGALWINALRHHMPLRRAVVLGIACASLYGVTDECHQLFVADRTCDPVDWLVDTCGATLGALLAATLMRHAKRVKQGVKQGT